MRVPRLFLALCILLVGAGAVAAGAAFSPQTDGYHAPAKGAGDVLDYSIDWSKWMAGDTIANSAIVFNVENTWL